MTAGWNKGKKVGRKPPLTPQQVALVRGWLEQQQRVRDLALFNLAIDSGLRGCDLLALRVCDVRGLDGYKAHITLTQRKTGKQVTFAVSERTRASMTSYVDASGKYEGDYLFTGDKPRWKHKPLSSVRYHQLIKEWLSGVGMDATGYGTHSLRRTQSSHIYKHTGNLRAAQVLLGHSDIRNTALYLGIEEAEALDIAERFQL